VVIGGGSGFIGSSLVRMFEEIGSKVWTVTRMPGNNSMTWSDIENNGLPKGTEIVINVAGQNVLDPTKGWSAGFKQNVVASRINTTRTLATAITKAAKPPKVFTSISGVGFYKAHPTQEYTEHSTGGNFDFFSHLCTEWEAASELPDSLPTRRVIIRSGVVLGYYGGMIKQLYLPFLLGVGGRIGSGEQWMPWIHIDDLARMFMFASEDENVTGVLNGVAPQPVTNQEFTTALAKAMWRPAIFPVPEFALNFAFGPERAKMMTEGQKVFPKRAIELGFDFIFPDIDSACKSIADGH
jgi:uncharacterized protein (TIGR01777 family)